MSKATEDIIFRSEALPLYGSPRLTVAFFPSADSLTPTVAKKIVGDSYLDLFRGEDPAVGEDSYAVTWFSRKSAPFAEVFIAFVLQDGGVFSQTVAHEAVHFAMFAARRLGLSTKPGADEALAYIVGWAVTFCHATAVANDKNVVPLVEFKKAGKAK